jgi:CMP-N,N'-diacetyllegionaminic acid synthase
MDRICTVCIRGGSKGVINKNLRQVAGLPLFAHSLRQAKQSGMFSAIAVSSDSEEILRQAAEHGADFAIVRPAPLASDAAPKIPAIVHCVESVEYRISGTFSVVVDLDATSPLRTVEDIRGAVALLEMSGAANVITGCPAHRSPYFNLVEVGTDDVPRLSKNLPTEIHRRQDAPRCFDMNASVYVWRRQALQVDSKLFTERTRFYEMPPERSLDIDTELDLELVTFLLSKRGPNET